MTLRRADTSCHGVRLLGGNGSIPLDRENPVLDLRSAKSFVVGIIDRQTLQSFTNGGEHAVVGSHYLVLARIFCPP